MTDDKKTLYQDLKEKGLIGFYHPSCIEYGCKNLETRCKDCGRLVSSATIVQSDGCINVTE